MTISDLADTAGVRGTGPLRRLVAVALDAIADGSSDRAGPFPAGRPDRPGHTMSAATGANALPDSGVGARQALSELARAFTAGAADPSHPACAAHLHCPPLPVAVAADLVVSALNPSLDSWDQAPSGTAVEREVVGTLAELVGYDPDAAAGSVTTGGTESNLTGLLLARERAAGRAFGIEAVRAGIPTERRLRVLCSAAAHFSVARATGVLGLGEDAIVRVPVDAGHRMDPAALRATIAAVRSRGEVPAAVVATAGTTDLGAVDPLPAVADAAASAGAWLHVDAAYGGGALFSARLASLLTGLGRADSVALDLHKLGWQPVPAGIFLVRDAAHFAPLERRVPYLDGGEDGTPGTGGLLGRSLRTTRRPDAFPIAVTLRALGRSGVGALVDRCHELARHAAAWVTAHPRLELYAAPVLSTVVFRYLPASGSPDRVNTALRRVLLAEGRAVIARTEIDGAVRLKLTLLNPDATERDVDTLLEAVVAAGDKEGR